MNSRVAIVFTRKSIPQIVQAGGTQSWRMHARHIGNFEYVICSRNRRRSDVEGPEAHGSAFLLGKVLDVVPTTDPNAIEKVRKTGHKRYLIRISEAALIDIPDFWSWGRWPVHYDDLSAFGIDPTKLGFKPLGDLVPTTTPPASLAPHQDWRATVEAAKVNLAAQLGVSPSAIDINLRL